MGNKDTDSLAHTTWECKYHIVFAPKYRRQVIYREIKRDVGAILRKLCEYKGIEIVEADKGVHTESTARGLRGRPDKP